MSGILSYLWELMPLSIIVLSSSNFWSSVLPVFPPTFILSPTTLVSVPFQIGSTPPTEPAYLCLALAGYPFIKPVGISHLEQVEAPLNLKLQGEDPSLIFTGK
jgi:hypothetical protein